LTQKFPRSSSQFNAGHRARSVTYALLGTVQTLAINIMFNFTITDILKITGGELFAGAEETPVKGFSIDSRTIKPGDIFIAVKGEHFDGHDFMDQAISRGASGIIAERSLSGSLSSNMIKVENTIEAMVKTARYLRGLSDIPVICITGTNGKTTVKDILSHILSAKYKVLKSEKSYNNTIGVCLTLFGLDASHQIAVLELGTNHFGEIRKLAEIALPDIAVINNIGRGHIEFFGDIEGVFKEKTSLLDVLPEKGTVFLNKDDAMLSSVKRCACGKKFFGKSSGSDLLISDIQRQEEGYSFLVNGEEFNIPLEGEHNVYNAAAAIAVAKEVGVENSKIKEKLAGVSLPEMRLQKLKLGDVFFINDSYNANPDSFKSALDVLSAASSGGRKGIIAGCMMELGGESDRMHRDLGEDIALKGFDFLITVGDSARHIAEGAKHKGMDPSNIFEADSNRTAADHMKNITKTGDVVLLKGSRKAKLEEVLTCFTTCCTR